MNITFEDMACEDNPRNGQILRDASQVLAALNELKHAEPPVLCELLGANGYSLTVGVDNEFGCVQYSANDDSTCLMALSQSDDLSDMEYMVGGTPTPIDGRYRLPMHVVEEIITTFVTSGQRSDRSDGTRFSNVEWRQAQR